MINNKERKLILDAFTRLHPLTLARGDGRRIMYAKERACEGLHRKFFYRRESPASAPMSLTSKYWVVRHILDPLYGDANCWTINDLPDVKESLFWGQAFANKYRSALLESFDGFDLEAFDKLDYVEMVAIAESVEPDTKKG